MHNLLWSLPSIVTFHTETNITYLIVVEQSLCKCRTQVREIKEISTHRSHMHLL